MATSPPQGESAAPTHLPCFNCWRPEESQELTTPDDTLNSQQAGSHTTGPQCNQGKRTAGIDGRVALENETRLELYKELKVYHPEQVRPVRQEQRDNGC